jgi:hypothetical protein
VAWAFVNLSYDHLAAGAIEVGALAKNMTVPETTKRRRITCTSMDTAVHCKDSTQQKPLDPLDVSNE